jgi:RNA polymerase sigma factor (sigma-70 family)
MEVSALTHPSTMPGLRGPSALLRLQSDERLIALTRRGQPAAFETLCTRYQSRLLSFCRHMLSSKEDAEDVLQEVFAAAFNAVLADDREINVRPWLYRIARNRSLNHLRRTAPIGVDSMDIHFAEHGISTGDKVLRRESFQELIGDVHELPETQRTALLLREIDALSYEQISQAMETTVPSVKSLLVRARISLAEAAEARKLSCEEVRLELGEAAEGLIKLSTPARRHVRGCDRCLSFKKHLRENNRALAAILPVGPLFMLKKVLLAKIGSTASAGGAHAAGAGATVGVGAGATVGAGAAATGGTGLTGGLMTAGAGALATKAVAGLAAAAIVTAGAVAADHAVVVPHHPHRAATASLSLPVEHYANAPLVVREQAQPISSGIPSRAHHITAGVLARRHPHHLLKVKAAILPPPTTPTPAVAAAPTTPLTTTPAAKPAEPQSTTQVTEVTTETTQLPTTTTTSGTPTTPTAPASTPPPETTSTGITSEPTAPESTTPTGTTPTTTPPPVSAPEVSTTTEPGATTGPGDTTLKVRTSTSPLKVETGGTAAPADGAEAPGAPEATQAAVHHSPATTWGTRRASRR